MFGSTTLDIVIGLILVYLLYSLLVTILGEIVSTNLGIRARMLQKAIERMLNDDDEGPGKKKPGRLKAFFITEPKDFKDTFTGKFYTYPSMKYLARGKRKNFF